MRVDPDRALAQCQRLWRQVIAAGLCSLLLVACGGDDETRPVTPLPASISVDLPPGRQALGASITFNSSVGTQADGLEFAWDFGDGQVSRLSSPQHSYGASGTYTVKLVVSNAAGEQVTGTAQIQVGDLALTVGRTCSAPDQAGWCWQRPLPQGQQLMAFDFASDLRGWAVGEGGTILATGDGGKTWNAQFSGTRLALNQVAFANDSVGWAAGSVGEMLLTLDGGAHWQRFSSGQSSAVTGIAAFDASSAAFHAGSFTYLTRNGGRTWARLSGPNDETSVHVATPSTWWSVSAGALWVRTQDKDWAAVPPPPPAHGQLLRQPDSVQALDARTALVRGYEAGYILDDGYPRYVFRRIFWWTSDAGITWREISLPTTDSFQELKLLRDGTLLLPAGYFGDSARISTDQGQSWTTVRRPSLAVNTYPTSIEVFSARRFMVRDSSGAHHFSTDGGASWLRGEVGGPVNAAMNSIWFFNSREGLAISSEGHYLKTANGGLTWTQASATATFGWSRMQFLPGSDTGWVVSRMGAIYKTGDRGATWLSPVQPTSVPTEFVVDFHFVDAQKGWAVASQPGSTGGAIYASEDGGSSWQPLTSTGGLFGLVGIRFADASNGVAVGPAGYVYVTADAGKTWSPKPTGTERGLRRVSFANANLAVAVGDGGVILRSVDRGQTWSRVNSPTANTLLDVRFTSSSRGYAVGDGGTLLTTNDGGLTWTVRDTGVSLPLRSVFFIDAYTGWVVGDGGAILVTTDGG